MAERYEIMPADARVVLSCTDCGATVWDREVHDGWHVEQAEMLFVLRTLSELAPGISPISVLGGPSRAAYERVATFTRTPVAGCPKCLHKAHGVVRCGQPREGFGDAPACECIYPA